MPANCCMQHNTGRHIYICMQKMANQNKSKIDLHKEMHILETINWQQSGSRDLFVPTQTLIFSIDDGWVLWRRHMSDCMNECRQTWQKKTKTDEQQQSRQPSALLNIYFSDFGVWLFARAKICFDLTYLTCGNAAASRGMLLCCVCAIFFFLSFKHMSYADAYLHMFLLNTYFTLFAAFTLAARERVTFATQTLANRETSAERKKANKNVA